MKIRGARNPVPARGTVAKAGVFKTPPGYTLTPGPHTDVLKHAHSAKGREALKTTSNGDKGLRHQKPKRG